MKSLNPSPENYRRKGVIGLGLLPDHGPAIVTIKVSYGLKQYEIAVPLNSTFGYLKSVIAQTIGLKPGTHKLLFRGHKKEDDENLQMSGVNDNSEMLLMEDSTYEQKIPEEVHAISRGEEDVAKIRQEVDKLEQQVYAMQAVVDSGTGSTVGGKEIIYLTEMLMRQLLKLDGIEAEGEGRIQRKMEVHRVQSIVDKMDALKSRIAVASKLSINTRWETPRL